MNRLLQFAWSLRRRLVGLLRLRTRGVKIMLFNAEGELLLIRNNYGDTNAFVLPGGGVGLGEEPIAAAARELREETGIASARLRLLGEYESRAEGKRDSVSLFHGSSGASSKADGFEVLEAGFFALSALPEGTSAATRRRISQWMSGGPYGGPW
jgi:8-oxo-dGTP pyrophosphatase MutT (NUDIX family)